MIALAQLDELRADAVLVGDGSDTPLAAVMVMMCRLAVGALAPDGAA